MAKFICNFRSRAEMDMDTVEAYSFVPREKCFVFVYSNPSNWLRRMSHVVKTSVPLEFMEALYRIEVDGTYIREIPRGVV